MSRFHAAPAPAGSRVIAGPPEIVTSELYGALEMAAAIDPALALVVRGNDFFMVARLKGKRAARIRITAEADPDTYRQWYETRGSATVLRTEIPAMKISWSIEGGKPREQQRLAREVTGWLDEAEHQVAKYRRRLALANDVGAA